MKPKIYSKTLVKSACIFSNKVRERVIKCSFPFNHFHLDEIKSIEGRKWNKTDKYWTIPLSLTNAFKLKDWNYTFDADLKDWANKMHLKRKNPIKDIKIEGLNGTLFDYQKQGVAFLENHDGRGLIADEMGLGKTIQAIAYMQLHKEKTPVIIVCPASLKLNWEKEIKTWMDSFSIQILSGTKIHDIIGHIIIINYDIISYWVATLKAINPQIIILDEVHYIKSNSAKRTKTVKKLCKGIPHVIGLSGTPIENKPIEIYNSIQIIDNSIFPDKWKFQNRYCGAKHNGFGWQFNGATNVSELHEILTQNVMIRRKKKDVLKDLPDKIYSFVPLEIDNRKEYKEAENDFIDYVRNGVEIEARKLMHEFLSTDFEDVININDHKLKRLQDEKAEKATALTQIEVLKQLAAKGKLKQMIEWIEDFLESGEKLVFFATHKFIISAIMEHFGKIAVKIDGSVSVKKRQEAVESFQTNTKIKLFVGNIKAAGVGLTLTASSNVAIGEYPWPPSELIQAIDRTHRIGQKNTVNAYFLIGRNTIDEKIIKLLQNKQKVLDAVLDGKDMKTDTNLLTELITTYK